MLNNGEHDKYMRLAVESALEGVKKAEGGPFGACIAESGKVISVAHNTVLKEGDPTCHAEMNAIRAAVRVKGSHILDKCTLYTTAEPCPMCMGAIYWARIPTVYIGADRECAAEFGFDDSYFYSQLELPHSEKEIKINMACMSEECRGVFEYWSAQSGNLY